jgi:ribosomal protein S18 acetylase RimI-like enzyme
MNESAPKFTLRKATYDDHTDVLAVMEEVAPEIPVAINTPERFNAVKDIIVDCCGSGASLVACDTAGTVVGFVLAKADVLERFQLDNEALSLRYIGVAKTARGSGILSALLTELMEAGEPLNASVLSGNKSAMVDRLVKAGFVETESTERDKSFRWQPSD